MLVHLSVRDLAIVDNLALELRPGMTALTGETGAGKSLLVDALELALGARASADLVRRGCEAAEVNAVFEPGPAAAAWLAERDLAEQDSCVLRRRVAADGRSRAFINARPVPVGELRALGRTLVDVHGQHAHQALLDSGFQRRLLDRFADHDALLGDVAAGHERLRALEREIDCLGQRAQDPADHLELLRYQIDELAAQPLEPAALDALTEEHRRLAHGEELLASVARAQALLGEDGAAAAARAAARALAEARRIDRELDGVHDLLVQSQTLIGEVEHALARYVDGLQTDSSRLAALERTLEVIHDLARKHRCAPERLHARLDELREQAHALEGSSERLAAARREHAGELTAWRSAAAELHRSRSAAGERLAAQANAVLAELGMQGAGIGFAVRHDDDAAPSAHGLDSVVLEASTNPGEPPLPLARVASGGELSRIALAVHGVVADNTEAGTLVFDEVDAGVGGAAAEILGRRMRALGATRQVLTVTHLAPVAAQAHHHAVVEKVAAARGHRSRIRSLTGEAREREIARMLGGVAVTERSLAHAREMLAAGARADAGGDGSSRPAA